jgi:hypothetical protein
VGAVRCAAPVSGRGAIAPEQDLRREFARDVSSEEIHPLVRDLAIDRDRSQVVRILRGEREQRLFAVPRRRVITAGLVVVDQIAKEWTLVER